MMRRTNEEAQRAFDEYVKNYQTKEPFRKYISGSGILLESRDLVVFLRESPPAEVKFPPSIDGVPIRYSIGGIIKPLTNIEGKL